VEENKPFKQRRFTLDINGTGKRGKRSSYNSATKRNLEKGPKLGCPLSICFIHDSVPPNYDQFVLR
jgi:hypothetical protein